MAMRNRLKSVAATDWSPRRARHLLNRAGFGVPEDRIAQLASLSPRAAVASLLEYQRTPDDLVAPNFLVSLADLLAYREEAKTLPEDQRRKLNNDMQARERAAMLGLQAWWIERMVHSPRPLQEKMTLFWHGHFATSAQKVKSSAANHQLNSLFRENATGNFKTLTTAVGQSPAMLRYLDNVQNVKGQPNENWARELMELFTMGVGHYTEDDIKESARAFTGWTTDNAGQFRFNEDRHDFGAKTVFGRSGNFDGWDMINLIFEQPVTAEFISAKLWTYFAYENPEPQIVTALADTLRANHCEIAPVLETIFMSEAFYSEKAVGTQIKSPAQFLVQLAQHLSLESPPYVALARAAGQLGQMLFYPPNVAGWDGGRAWINANTLLTRYNMSRSIVVADFFEPDEMSTMDMRAMGGDMGKAYRQQFQSALENVPPAQRKEIRAKMEAAPTQEERRTIIENTMIELEAGRRWNVQAIFGGLNFTNAGECVKALAARYLNTPLSAEQEKVLIAALSPSGSPEAVLSAETLTHEEMTSALHLLFSLAEYQLC
jgi:uncharacterized protein (DUF1800 family)